MPMKWREGDIHSELEKRPVLGGTDSDGSLMYVGRAEFNGMTLPAKIIPARNAAYVSFDGQEIEVETFEYLSGKMKHFQWVPASNGTIAEGAVVAGWSDPDGEELYVGRASHEGSVTIGKIHPSQGCLYMAYGGEEIPFDSYEVLIYKRNAFTSSGDSDEDSE